MSKEKLRKSTLELPILSKEDGLDPLTIIDILAQLSDAAAILQDSDMRAQLLVDHVLELNSVHLGHLEHSDKLRKLPAFGSWHMVAATSYKSIEDVFKLKIGRFDLQKKLSKKIGDVVTQDDERWKVAANLSRPYTRPKENQERPEENHTAIARRDIAATFDRFKKELTSKEGMPATTLTVEMIYKIMTDTVFGGYDDEDFGSWKDDIVYYLKHLIDVQQSYAIGVYTENLPKLVQRTLMRLVAKKQGVSDVLEEMLRIEDDIFPKITQWIEEQQEKNLSEEELNKMGVLGAILRANRAGRSKEESRADIFGIYMAALDSTANASNWLLAEFAQNPEILSKVARLQGDDRTEYIKFILFELWRKDPITPIIFRQVPADEGRTMPDGMYLPPRTIVLLSVGAAGRDPVRFSNPEVFDPDRYYRMTAEERDQVELDLDLVFARDKHKCQGQKLPIVL